MEGWFGFFIGIDIAVLFVILWLIFYGRRFELCNPAFCITAAATAIVALLVWTGMSPQWLWIPEVWILGLGIPYVAGLAVLVHLHIRNRGKKTITYHGCI